MRKVKYASELPPENYTFHPARKFQLSLQGLKNLYPGDLNKCMLVALDSQQISVLLSMLTVFPKYHWVWGLPSPRKFWDNATKDEWAEIETFVNQLEVCLMAGCDIGELIRVGEDLVKTQRMIVAAFMGQAVNFDTEELPNAVNYSQGIRQAILSVGGAIDDGMTIQELIDAINALDLTGTNFIDTLHDILEILLFLSLLFGPNQSMTFALSWWDKMTLKRWQHNNLTIQAHQATSLRGIMKSITPMKENSEPEEKTLWETLGSIPWMARAVVAIAEPSPGGEIALIATTIGGAIQNIYNVLKEAYNIWWNKWVNLIEEPEPVETLTAALGVIANKISTREDLANNPNVSLTNRLDVIAEALEDIGTENLVPVLQAIATNIANLDDMPEGANWELLFESLNLKLEETMPVINITCGSCGSSGGCSCGGGGGGGSYGSGVGGPGDRPPIEVPSGGTPPGFPTVPAYNEYKCKAANVLVLNFAERLAQIADSENVNLTQYPSYNLARDQIVARLQAHTLAGIPLSPTQVNWLADFIMNYIWPYPNEDSIALSIFEGIRLEYLLDRTENVCALYNSNDTGEAREAIQDKMDEYIDATSFDGTIKSKAKEAVAGILSNDFLNRLFVKDSSINVYSDSSSVDCTGCVGNIFRVCYDEFAEMGEVIVAEDLEGNCGTAYAGCYSVYLRFNYSGEEYMGGPCKVNVEVVTGEVEIGCSGEAPAEPFNGWTYYDQAGTQIGEDLTEQDPDICCGSLLMVSENVFSIRVISVAVC